MEDLKAFVGRLSGSIKCHYHLTKSGYYSLKKIDSNQRGRMGVFSWVTELKRKGFFRIDSYKSLGDKGGVSKLADGIKEGMHFISKKNDTEGRGTGIFFNVKRGSHGKDYKNAVKALRAIMVLK